MEGRIMTRRVRDLGDILWSHRVVALRSSKYMCIASHPRVNGIMIGRKTDLYNFVPTA